LFGAVLIDQERSTILLIDGQMVGPRDRLLRCFEIAVANEGELEALRRAG
jgi:hypothetical protein